MTRTTKSINYSTTLRTITLVASDAMPHVLTPCFPYSYGIMFHRTHAEMPRTNNHIEGWHRRFQGNMSFSHPTFWKFLDVLKKEQNITRVEIFQAVGGHPPPAQRRRYLDCNSRILAIVDDYPNRAVIQYLRSISYNFSL